MPKTPRPSMRRLQRSKKQEVPTRAQGPAKSGTLSLRLYVAGLAPNSVTALANLRTVCSLLGPSTVVVVDVLKDPERALEDRILVTPTLVKVSPLPQCRLSGNLSNTQEVLACLAS